MGGDRRHGALVPGAAMAPAHAGPINAPSIQPFPIACGGTTHTAAVVPRQGGRTRRWSPPATTFACPIEEVT